MTIDRFRLFILGLVLCFHGQHSSADWINLTGAETAPNIAEIYVLEDRVKLVLEVYVGDLELFEALVPDDWMIDKASAAERPSQEARLREFAQQTFRVVPDPAA